MVLRKTFKESNTCLQRIAALATASFIPLPVILTAAILLPTIFLPLAYEQTLLADEYPYTYRSAYFLGRGGAGLAIADNEDAIFYNPAGLALGKGLYKKIVLASPMLEFSRDTRDVIREIALEDESPTSTLRSHQGIPQHFGLNTFTGIILRRAAIGFFASDSTTMMLYKSPDAGSMETVYVGSTTNVGATFSLAQDYLNKKLLVGITGKFIIKAQANFNANAAEAESLKSVKIDQIAMQGQGVGADIGVMYKYGGDSGMTLGLTLQDMGTTSMEPSMETTLSKEDRALKDNVQTVNIGVAFEPGRRASRIKFMIDARDLENNTKNSFYKRLHLGTELTVKGVVGMSAGINQGYPAFGFYIDARLVRLDLGIYTEEIDDLAGRRPDTRYFFRLAAGL